MAKYRTPLMKLTLAEGEASLGPIQLFRVGTFHHDEYGQFEITPEVLAAMEKNFKAGVRGIDIAIDYKHASEDVAAGWVKKVYLSEDKQSLWAEVEWTPKAKQMLSEKEFRYISPEFMYDYQDNESLKKFGPTLLGAGLTNRPTIKKMEPVVELTEAPLALASEDEKDSKNDAVWVCAGDEKTCDLCDELDGKKLSELDGKTPPLHDNCRCSVSEVSASEKKSKKLADPLQECVSSKVGDLVNEGHDQDQAIAIAYSKCEKEQQASEKKDEQKPKQKGGQAMDYKAMDPAQVDAMSPEQLKEMVKELLAKMQSMEAGKLEVEKEMGAMKEEKALAEKKSAFAKLLSEGKACKAQEEAYLAGDMVKFVELTQPVQLSEKGSTKVEVEKKKIETAEEAQDEIMRLARIRFSEKKSKTLGDAVHDVLVENKELEQKIYQ